MNIRRGSSPTITFNTDSDTGFYVPGGTQVRAAIKGEPHYVVTPQDYAEFRLYRLLDYKVPFVVKESIVQELYKSFLVEGVRLDDRSGG